MYEEVLKLISTNKHELSLFKMICDIELSLPNIPFPTMGGHVFWNTYAECNGWKLQQHMLTHHARIIDDNNIRVAWGNLKGMLNAFLLYDDMHKRFS